MLSRRAALVAAAAASSVFVTPAFTTETKPFTIDLRNQTVGGRILIAPSTPEMNEQTTTAADEAMQRLRYTWERNAVNNWQNDPLAPFTSFVGTGANFLWMAYDNPNYNVQVIAASLIASW
jgi:hypothetical protein